MALEIDPNLLGFVGVLLTIVGIGIGIVVTILVTRHYYNRQQHKQLSPYTFLSSAVFRGIDPSVRKDLRISYRGTEIADLFELQVVIANDGERGISCIDPLSIAFPPGVKLLDAAILHRDPNELKVDVSPPKGEPGGATRVAFPFPVLNSGEYFVVKFLLDGKLKPSDLRFDVSAEDVPHKLPLKRLPPTVFNEGDTVANKEDFWIGLGIMAFAVLLGYGTVLLHAAYPQMFPIPWNTYQFNVIDTLLVIAWLVVPLSVTAIAVMAMVSGGRPQRRKKSRFTLPQHMTRNYRPVVLRGYDGGPFMSFEVEENEATSGREVEVQTASKKPNQRQ